MIPEFDDLEWIPCALCGRNPAVPGEQICDQCLAQPSADGAQEANSKAVRIRRRAVAIVLFALVAIFLALVLASVG